MISGNPNLYMRMCWCLCLEVFQKAKELSFYCALVEKGCELLLSVANFPDSGDIG